MQIITHKLSYTVQVPYQQLLSYTHKYSDFMPMIRVIPHFGVAGHSRTWWQIALWVLHKDCSFRVPAKFSFCSEHANTGLKRLHAWCHTFHILSLPSRHKCTPWHKVTCDLQMIGEMRSSFSNSRTEINHMTDSHSQSQPYRCHTWEGKKALKLMKNATNTWTRSKGPWIVCEFKEHLSELYYPLHL